MSWGGKRDGAGRPPKISARKQIWLGMRFVLLVEQQKTDRYVQKTEYLKHKTQEQVAELRRQSIEFAVTEDENGNRIVRRGFERTHAYEATMTNIQSEMLKIIDPPDILREIDEKPKIPRLPHFSVLNLINRNLGFQKIARQVAAEAMYKFGISVSSRKIPEYADSVYEIWERRGRSDHLSLYFYWMAKPIRNEREYQEAVKAILTNG